MYVVPFLVANLCKTVWTVVIAGDWLVSTTVTVVNLALQGSLLLIVGRFDKLLSSYPLMAFSIFLLEATIISIFASE